MVADEKLPEGTDTIIAGASGSSGPGFTADTGFAAERSAGTRPSDGGEGGGDAAKGAWFDRIDALKSQGFDSARAYAVSGKDRATTALDDLIRMVNDAATQIDDKIGGQYGDYARKAADSLGSFNEGLKGKDVDELFNDARTLVAKAPAVAVGTAAALGFVVARLARAGLPEDDGTAKPKAKAKTEA